MGKVILITSGKGGVGKTTLSASLGKHLAQKGYRVLLVDGDMGLRDLDLVLGVQDEVIFTARDLWKKDCFKEDALISLNDKLDFLAASQKYRWEDIKEKSLLKLIKKLRKEYDYIIVDAPAGIGIAIESLIRRADEIIVVIEPTWMSVRDSQKLMEMLRNHKIRNYGIVINKVFVDEGEQLIKLESLIDNIDTDNLISILPHSHKIAKMINEGQVMAADSDDDFDKMMNYIVTYLEELHLNDLDELLHSFNSIKQVSTKNSQERLRVRRGYNWRWRNRFR